MTIIFSVIFGEHTNAEKIAAMLSALQACGKVSEAEKERAYAVEVRRASSLAYLQEQLMKWELHGFLKYKKIE